MKEKNKEIWWTITAIFIIFGLPILIILFKYFVLGIRFFSGGPEQCWGGQSCY